MQDNDEILKGVIDPARRSFFRKIGKFGLGAAAGSMILNNLPKLKGQTTVPQDDANQILLAAMVAEDLATTFYYNGLIGGVIQDPALAGPGGTATSPSASGNVPNVDYLRAALGQEIAHANLLRAVGNFGTDATSDPYQTFYFPAGTFDTLASFTSTLEALESAFIGAYLTAVRELADLAQQTSTSVPDGPYGGPYSSAQLRYFAMVAASIMGIECEHRALGGVILNENQPNNLYFEQTDNIFTVYNGPTSAVVALTPFLTPATGPSYTLATALAGATAIELPSTGNPPAFQPSSITASPNPIPVAAGAQYGATTLSWSAPAGSFVQVHINAPDGPLFAESSSTGSMATGPWVPDGMVFYLQNANNMGTTTTPGNTLATVTIHLQPS